MARTMLTLVPWVELHLHALAIAGSKFHMEERGKQYGALDYHMLRSDSMGT
jgi:hypothetical protein